MSDFICEQRTTSRTSTMGLDGFVAEMRPSSRHRRSEPLRLAMQTEDKTALKFKHRIEYDQIPDQSIETLLLNKSKEEYTDILTTSVIKLIHTLLTGRNVASIKGDVEVTFLRDELPIHVKLNETYTLASLHERNNFDHLELKKEFGSIISKDCSLSPELNWGIDNCQFDSHFSPDPCHRDDISSVGSSPPRTDPITSDYSVESIDLKCEDQRSPRNIESMSSDSGEESGYITNDSDRLPNDYIDQTPVKDTFHQGNVLPRPMPALELHTTASPRVAFDNDEFERPLVIDMNHSPGGDIENCAVATMPEQEGSVGHDSSATTSSEKKVNLGSSLIEDNENSFQMTSSDETDSDVPMDLSGDCKIIMDSVSVSGKQGSKVTSSLLVKKLKCKFCPHRFSDGISLSKHAFQTHQIYMCHHCSRVFTAKNNLKRHIRIHTGLRPYKCSQCSMTFARRDDLKGHVLRHDYNKPFRCSICKKGYTDRACVKNHMVKEHGSRLMHVCPQCGESFDQDDIFSKHKKTHPELMQYACDICPFIGSNNLMSCKHNLVHTRKLFSCKPCNAYFADPFGYTDHIRKHKKSETYTSYVCCFCDMVLLTYEQFVRHEYSHAHPKMQICGICDKQFRSKALLQEHIQNHNSVINESSVGKTNAEFNNLENPKQDYPLVECIEDMEMLCEETNSMICSGSDGPQLNGIDIPKTKDNYNNVEEEVLDLTIKKPVINSDKSQCNTIAQSMNNGEEKTPNSGVPRNGYSAEFSCPREKNSAIGYFGEVKNWVPLTADNLKSETQFNVSFKSQDHLSQSIDFASSHQQIPEEKNQHKSTAIRCTSSNENLPPSSNVYKCPSQLKREPRYAPYSMPSKAAELASKFILARGRSAFVHASAMKELNNSHCQRIFCTDRTEMVLENANTGKSSVRTMSGSATHINRTYSVNEHSGKKENDIQGRMSPVVYGLTGTQYRQESQVSNETPLKSYTQIKCEPSVESILPMESVLDNIPDTVPSHSLRDSPTPSAIQNCDICLQTFESFSQLESHSVLTHKRYMCEYCGKGFTSRPNRDRHVRYHTGERPYKCDLCESAFHRGDDLKYHRTTRHPEATPFACIRCSANFTWKRDLDRHIRHSKCRL